MSFAYNPFTDNLDLKGSGGGGSLPVTVPTTFNTDSTPATPSANQIKIKAQPNAGSTITFSGAGDTVTFSLTDGPKSNILLGQLAGNLGVTGTSNVGIGFATLNSLSSGVNNSAYGYSSMAGLTSGGLNCAYGTQTLNTLTSGTLNCAFGAAIGINLKTGSRNLFLGSAAGGTAVGDAYSGAESNNILIANVGVPGESNVCRIGTQGSGAGQVSQCFLAGVLNTNSGRTVKVTRPGAYPYAIVITDEVVNVDTSATANTITLPAVPKQGTRFTVKDGSATASVNNITINGNGNNIVGATIAATLIISLNGASVTLVFDINSWIVI